MLTRASISDFVAHLTNNGGSENTVRAYRTDLTQACDWLTSVPVTWPELDRELARYLTAHRSEWAPKTTQRRLGTFRSWAKWAGAGAFLTEYRSPTPAQAQPHPIPEGIEGVLRMINSTRNPKHRALCVLTGLLGLRVGEAIAVEPGHFDLNEMTLRVRGKGDKTRFVPVGGTAYRLLAPRIKAATAHRETLVQMNNSGARRAVIRHARNANLSRRVSSHDMRATFATAAWERSHDLRAVQELLGHADAKTTQTYTLVSPAAMRSAAAVA